MSRFVSSVTSPHTRGPNAPLRPEQTSSINITTANGTSINIYGSHIQLEVENVSPHDAAARRGSSLRKMTKELEQSEDEDNRTTVLWEETRGLDPDLRPSSLHSPIASRPFNAGPSAVIPEGTSPVARTRVESIRSSLPAHQGAEGRNVRPDNKISGTSSERSSSRHDGLLSHRDRGSGDVPPRIVGTRVPSGPAAFRSPEPPIATPKGPHSPSVIQQHETPQSSTSRQIPVQSKAPSSRSVSNPVPIQSSHSVAADEKDDDDDDDDKDGAGSISSSWRRHSSRFGDAPLQDMIPPIVSTPAASHFAHHSASDSAEHFAGAPRAPSPFERQEVVQSTPAMSLRTMNEKRESVSVVTPSVKASEVGSRKGDAMSKTDHASRKWDGTNSSRADEGIVASSTWQKTPLPPSEAGGMSVVGSTHPRAHSVVDKLPYADGDRGNVVENTPTTVTKERYGMHTVKSSKASTVQTPEMVAAPQFSSKIVQSSQIHSLPVKDDSSEGKSSVSAWKKVPLPSQSGISSTATTTPVARPIHTPHPESSEKNKLSSPAKIPEPSSVASWRHNIAPETPGQLPSASKSVLDDDASSRSGSGSHHTGPQSVVGGASSSSRTSKMRLTFGSTPPSPLKQQSMSAQQYQEQRTHAPPTDTPSGRSIWRSKLLPNSEAVSEDGKPSRVTSPGIPVPFESGSQRQPATGGSQKARSGTPSNASAVDRTEERFSKHTPSQASAETPGPFGMKTESLDPLAHPGSIDTAPPAIGRLSPTSPEVEDAWAQSSPHPSGLGKIETMISGPKLDHFPSKPESLSATETLPESQQTAKPTPSTLRGPGNPYIQSLSKSQSSGTSRKTQTPFRAPLPVPRSEPGPTEPSPKHPPSILPTPAHSPRANEGSINESSPNLLGLVGVGPSESGLSGSGSLKRQVSKIGQTGSVAPSTPPETPKMMAMMSVPT